MKIQYRFAGAVALLAAIVMPGARAASIGPGDFLVPSITTFDGLGASSPEALPYIVGGNTFSSSVQNTFFYGDFGATGDCYANECIGSSSAEGRMTITPGSPVSRIGFWLGVSSAQVSFFDTDGMEIHSETVTPPAIDASNVWIGWEADSGLIGSIGVVGLDSTHIFTIDNLTVEATPEPATFAEALSGSAILFGIARARRQRAVR